MTRMHFRAVLILTIVGCSTRDLEYLRDGKSSVTGGDASTGDGDGSAGNAGKNTGVVTSEGGAGGTNADAHDDGAATGGTIGDASLAGSDAGLAGGNIGDSAAGGALGTGGTPTGTGGANTVVDASEGGGPQPLLLCSFPYAGSSTPSWESTCSFACGSSGGTTLANADDQGGGGSVGSVDFLTTWTTSGKTGQRSRVFYHFDFHAYNTMVMWVKVLIPGIAKAVQPFVMCGQDSTTVFLYGPQHDVRSLSAGWNELRYDLPHTDPTCSLTALTAIGLQVTPDTSADAGSSLCDAGVDGDADAGNGCQMESSAPVSIEAEVLIDTITVQ